MSITKAVLAVGDKYLSMGVWNNLLCCLYDSHCLLHLSCTLLVHLPPSSTLNPQGICTEFYALNLNFFLVLKSETGEKEKESFSNFRWKLLFILHTYSFWKCLCTADLVVCKWLNAREYVEIRCSLVAHVPMSLLRFTFRKLGTVNV